jgi:hypothetical protein
MKTTSLKFCKILEYSNEREVQAGKLKDKIAVAQWSR